MSTRFLKKITRILRAQRFGSRGYIKNAVAKLFAKSLPVKGQTFYMERFCK
jgi:hypothetical protein